MTNDNVLNSNRVLNDHNFISVTRFPSFCIFIRQQFRPRDLTEEQHFGVAVLGSSKILVSYRVVDVKESYGFAACYNS